MREELKALDGLRGLAAFYVLIHDAGLGLTQSYQHGFAIHPEKYEWYDRLVVYVFACFKYGHEAVIIFFILSGFLIHLKQARPEFTFNNFDIRTCFQKRFFRIYPTLIISIILCMTCDLLTSLFVHDFRSGD